MEKIKAKRYEISAVISVLAAICTVVPAEASKPCALGYYAHCSWTPWSTLICLAIAGALYWIGRRKSGAAMNGW